MSNPLGKPEQPQPLRKSYEPPRLEALGTIAEITQGIAGADTDNAPDTNGSVL